MTTTTTTTTVALDTLGLSPHFKQQLVEALRGSTRSNVSHLFVDHVVTEEMISAVVNFSESPLNKESQGEGEGGGHSLSIEFKIFCFILYSLIFLFGMLGNVLFCYVVISSRSMNSVTYRLLVNLSVSDLLITCLCGPVHVTHTIVMGYWPFGVVFCYTISYFQGITVLVSSYTLVVISFERYMSILHPLRPVIPRGYTRYVIMGIWIGSALASIPIVLQTKFMEVGVAKMVCTSEMDDFFHYYSLVFSIVQYFLPIVIMTYCYSMVATTIWRRRDILQEQTHGCRSTREMNMLNGRKKMIKMLIVVVACYTMCWLPFNIYWVLGLAIPSSLEGPWSPYVFTIVHILAVSHTCYNPVIYCWMNSRVRYGFIDVVGKLRFIRKCLPHVDWDNSRLSRTAMHSQYTEFRRGRQTLGGSGNVAFALKQNHNRKTGASIRDEVVQTNGNGAIKIPEQKRVLVRNSQSTSSNESFTGALGPTVTTNGQSKTNRLPKLSTTSNNFEMAELLREEPLMMKARSRFHKVSLTSNATQATDVSASTDVTGSSDGSSSRSSSFRDRLSRSRKSGMKHTGSWRESKRWQKPEETTNKDLNSIVARRKQLLTSSSPGSKKTISEDVPSIIDENPEEKDSSPTVAQDESMPEPQEQHQPKLVRSVSQEIAEQCLVSVHNSDIEVQADDRYN